MLLHFPIILKFLHALIPYCLRSLDSGTHMGSTTNKPKNQLNNEVVDEVPAPGHGQRTPNPPEMIENKWQKPNNASPPDSSQPQQAQLDSSSSWGESDDSGDDESIDNKRLIRVFF